MRCSLSPRHPTTDKLLSTCGLAGILNWQLRPLEDIAKQTRCDAQGNFAFANVRHGAWFVLTRVQWVVGNNAQGGALMQEVAVTDGQTIQVLLTERDFISAKSHDKLGTKIKVGRNVRINLLPKQSDTIKKALSGVYPLER